MFAGHYRQAATPSSYQIPRGLLFVMIAIVTGIAVLGVISSRVQNGRIDGRVLDNGGNVVNGATVDARRLVTGEVTRVETGGDGSFVLAAVRPGKYSLTVQAPGYAALSVTRLVVRSSERVRREFVVSPLQ